MKKFIVFALLAVSFLFVISAAAQDEKPFENPTYTEEFIAEQEAMLGNLDRLFPRTLLNETYDKYQDYHNEQFDGYTFISENIDGRKVITIRADVISETEQYDRGWNLFNTVGSYQNFYFHVNVQLIDQDESNKGFIWFQYSNLTLVGDASRCSGEIIFPDRVDSYKTVSSEREYTTYYNLTQFENDYDEHTLEMIRLDGYTSVFIDGHFIVGFEDGFTGRFHHLYGVGLNPGGEYATYAFDNFIIRRQ